MKKLALFTIVLAIAWRCVNAETFLNAKLANKENSIRSVTLLPPTAQFKAEGPKRFDYEEQEAEQITSAVADAISGPLKKRGWDVDDNSFSLQALQDKEELRWLVGSIRERYQMLVCSRTRFQNAVAQIKPKDVTKGRYSVDGVASLSPRIKSDVLVLVHADGTRPTLFGKIWHALDSYGVSLLFDKKKVQLKISLVDPQTGEILCFIKTSSAEEERILEELRKVP